MDNLKKINLSQYITDSIKIAKSFHIYLDTLYKQSKIMTYKIYGTIPDKKKSKYVLNMAGMLSDYDDVVKLDSGELLTVDLVKENEYIKEELKKFDVTYDSLVMKNGHMATYIKGCIAGINLDKVMEAKDGEILWYNESLFTNEKTVVMANVQNFIYNFLDIYSNGDYVVDELYAAGLISNLYSILPMVILVEKLKYALTFTADDFHIYNYFKSNKALDNEVDILDRKTLIWLYGNYALLKTNIGNNEILQSILDNIMDSLGIGIGKSYIEKSLPKINNDIANNKDNYYTKDIRLKQFRLNNSFSLNVGKVDKIKDVLIREYEQDYIKNKEQIEIEDENINYKIKYSIPTKELTKLLNVDDIILINLNDTNKFAYFINALIYQTKFRNDKYYLNFFNPSDGIVYKLNSKQVITLFLYLTFKIFNIDANPTINFLSYNNVLDLSVAKNFNIDNYNLNSEEKILISDILKDIKKLPYEITTIDSFRTYFKVSYDILHRFWYYLSNINDIMYSTDLLFVVNTLFTSGRSELLNNNKLSELMKEVNLPIKEVPKENIIPTFKRLLELILNDNVYEIEKIKEYLNKILRIGKKLTSYTVQFLYSNDLSYVITGHYQTLKPMLGKKSVLTVTDSSYSFYEKINKTLINKNIPFLKDLDERDISSRFRLYRPCKLEIFNLDNKQMLTRQSDISFIRTGDTFPAPLRPSTFDVSLIPAEEINSNYSLTTNYIKTYQLEAYGHKETIGSTEYVTNISDNKIPNPIKPSTLNINGYYTTELNVTNIEKSKTYVNSKLKILSYDGITPDMEKVTLNKYIPNNYKPLTDKKDTINSDINVTNKDYSKVILGYNPSLINYSNIIEDSSRLVGNKYLNNQVFDVLTYNGDRDKLVEQVKNRATKNITLSKPIAKHVPEIMTNNENLITTKVKPQSHKATGIDPSDDIIYKDIVTHNNKLTRNPSIVNADEISTNINSRINNENIKMYRIPILSYNNDKDKLIEQVKNRGNKNIPLANPIIKQVPEILGSRNDIVVDKVKPQSHKATGIDPSDDIVYKNITTHKNKLTRNPSLANISEISTGNNSRINNENINMYKIPILTYDNDKDKLIEQNKLRATKNIMLSKPIAKHVPEILSNRSDVIFSKVKPQSHKAGGVDPSEDIVYKDIVTHNNKLINKPTITKVDEINTTGSRLNKENIKFMDYGILGYDNYKDDISTQKYNRTLIDNSYSGPTVAQTPEITSQRSDVVINKLNTLSPKAGGVDPSDDIVYKSITTHNRKEITKPQIAATNGILTNYTYLNNGSIRYYSPDSLLHPEDFEQRETNRNNNVNKVNQPHLAQTPEITTIRQDSNYQDSKLNVFSPNANGVDPSDDIANTEKTNPKIRNIEQPVIRVSRNEDVEDIPVIKIKR